MQPTLLLYAPSGNHDVGAGIGVEQSDRSPTTIAGGDLLLLSHGYLADLAQRPALRGIRVSRRPSLSSRELPRRRRALRRRMSGPTVLRGTTAWPRCSRATL